MDSDARARRLFQHQKMLAETRPGHGAEGLVECDQDAFFFDGKAEQIGIGDLLMAEDAALKRLGQ